MNKVVKISVILLTLYLAGCQAKHSNNLIAFSRLTGDYWQIWTMQPDGGKAVQLTKSESDKRYPIWTSNGKEILFRDNNNRAYMVNLATVKEEKILKSFGYIGSLVPSPDDKQILFVRFQAELRDNSNLWIASKDGQNQRILTRDAGLQYDAAWSPDGKEIAYISGQGYQKHNLFLISSSGSNKRQLTNDKAMELLPAISPEGKNIAYVSDITGNFDIWLMELDGQNPRQLTVYEGIDTRPCWSPDGKRIMFVSDRSGSQQIWIMNSDGSNPKQLTRLAPSMDPTWLRKN